MASTYLSWTPSNTETSPYKRTISVWCKRANVSNEMVIISARPTQRQFFRFETTGELRTLESGGLNWSFITNAKYRDTNGWYHIVFAYDSTQATSTDRMKLYVNGEQVTSFSSITYPPLNETIDIGRSGYPIHIGNDSEQTNPYFDGLMSHFHMIDGTAYQASDFGELDSNGVWKPKTAPSVTYGTNGFFLKFENSGSMGTDSSGNGNNFTVNGSLTQTLDTPSNVYATWNPLIYTANKPYYSIGNTVLRPSTNTNYIEALSTLAIPQSGKWYAEFKKYANDNYFMMIIGDYQELVEALRVQTNVSASGGTYGYALTIRNDGDIRQPGESDISGFFPSSIANGDIIGIAVDMDNKAVYAHKNGTYGSIGGVTGIPTSGSSKTGAIDLSAKTWFTSSPALSFGFGTISSGGWDGVDANFGNGYFGTTPVSSAGSNGNGSIFEYDVPTGYYALNTKNLATYG